MCIGGCQNYGPFLGTLLQYGTSYLGKGTIILRTTHIAAHVEVYKQVTEGFEVQGSESIGFSLT